VTQWLHGSGFTAFVWTVGTIILTLQGLQNVIYLLQLGRAVPEFLRARRRASRLREWWLLSSENTPPVTLLVPGYNEEATIVESVRSLLTLQYPELEIVVVNDGSKDNTLARLIEAFELQPARRALPHRVDHQPVLGLYGTPRLPGLLVVDKKNGGKADALNAALDLARHPLVCAVDADSLLDADALLKAVRPFIDEPESTAAVGGTIRVVNGCVVKAGQVLEVRAPSGWVELFQAVEYIRAFLMARVASSVDDRIAQVWSDRHERLASVPVVRRRESHPRIARALAGAPLHACGYFEHRILLRLLRDRVRLRCLHQPVFFRARRVLVAAFQPSTRSMAHGVWGDRRELRLSPTQQRVAGDGHLAVSQKETGLGRYAAEGFPSAKSMIRSRRVLMRGEIAITEQLHSRNMPQQWAKKSVSWNFPRLASSFPNHWSLATQRRTGHSTSKAPFLIPRKNSQPGQRPASPTEGRFGLLQ
jgi:glycosyltransferase involved in cell wall biosynthesis